MKSHTFFIVHFQDIKNEYEEENQRQVKKINYLNSKVNQNIHKTKKIVTCNHGLLTSLRKNIALGDITGGGDTAGGDSTFSSSSSSEMHSPCFTGLVDGGDAADDAGLLTDAVTSDVAHFPDSSLH